MPHSHDPLLEPSKQQHPLSFPHARPVTRGLQFHTFYALGPTRQMPFLGLGRPDTSVCRIPNDFHELSENKMSYHSESVGMVWYIYFSETVQSNT